MSILKNISTHNKLVLKNYHTVGRSKTSALCLPHQDISKNHAAIAWENGAWYLKDYSRNGTMVGQKLYHHQTAKLEKDAIIRFGSDSQDTWQLTSDTAPTSYLIGTDKELQLIKLDQDHIAYPDAENPLVSFFKSPSMIWMIDDNESTRRLIHGTQYLIEDKQWTFFENEPMAETFDHASVTREARLDCYLSADEETVEIKIVINDLEMSLGEKVYNFLLLLLARQRLADKAADLPEREQGWLFVEPLLGDLSKELFREVDVYYFNVMIHRFRDHVKQLKPYGHLFTNIIERKRGKIRLNYSIIRIIKENEDVVN